MKPFCKFLLLFIFISHTAFAQTEGWPNLDQALTKFYGSYEVPLTNSIVLLGRKPDGWYVYGMEDSKMKEVQWKEHFWDAQTGTYLRLERPLIKRPSYKSPKDKKTALRYHDKVSFERFPFFGYVGWELDVVKWYENEKKERQLKEAEWEKLGRVYSILATQTLRDQYGFRNPSLPTFGYQKVPKILLTTYLNWTKKSLEAFATLKERNPDYLTYIGDIGIKHANTYMATYLELLTVKEEAKAREYANVEDLYPERIVAYAQNALNSCARGSILITYGDNDTYPLWYVQEALGFRKDVSVVNYSLLALVAYNSMIKDQLGIQLQIEDSAYEKLDYLFFDQEDSAKRTPLLKDLIQEMSRLENPPKSLLSSKNFIQEIDLNQIRSQFPNLKNEDAMLRWEGALGEDYITRNEIALWDIFASNDWKRPIYFAGTFDARKLKVFDKMVWKEGIHFRLIPQANSWNSIFSSAGHNLAYSQSYFLKAFEGEKLDLSLIHSSELFPQKDNFDVFRPERGVYGNFVSFYLQMLQETFSSKDIQMFELLDDKFRGWMDFENHHAQNQFVYYFMNYFRLAGQMNLQLGRMKEGKVYLDYMLRSLEAYPTTAIRFDESFINKLLEEVEKLDQMYKLDRSTKIAEIRKAMKEMDK